MGQEESLLNADILDKLIDRAVKNILFGRKFQKA